MTASITLRYDPAEDRILALIDDGSPEALAFWLTRRLTRNVIAQGNAFLERMSPVAQKTPMALRAELAEMERQVALARTEGAVSHTPDGVLSGKAEGAELAVELTIARQGGGFLLTLIGRKGLRVSTAWSRDHLQRIVDMLEKFAAHANWREEMTPTGVPVEGAARLVRH